MKPDRWLWLAFALVAPLLAACDAPPPDGGR